MAESETKEQNEAKMAHMSEVVVTDPPGAGPIQIAEAVESRGAQRTGDDPDDNFYLETWSTYTSSCLICSAVILTIIINVRETLGDSVIVTLNINQTVPVWKPLILWCFQVLWISWSLLLDTQRQLVTSPNLPQWCSPTLLERFPWVRETLRLTKPLVMAALPMVMAAMPVLNVIFVKSAATQNILYGLLIAYLASCLLFKLLTLF